MARYLSVYDHRHDRSERRDGGQTLLIGAGLGLLAGVCGYAYYRAQRDRDGLVDRPSDSAPGRTARQSRSGDHAVAGRTVTINRPRQELYRHWRDFQNLAAFMENVRSVKPLNGTDDTCRWTIRGPADRDVTLDTRIVSDRPDEEIAWRSMDSSQINTEGKVVFRDAPGNRGTEVEAIVAYTPPGGELGRWIAKLFQAEPSIQGRRELKRFKMLMETGEIATSDNRKEMN